MEDIKLWHGDCLEEMKKIADKSVDCIICDLPYGTTANKWDVIIPFEELWKEYKRIIKDNGAIVLFANEPFASYLRLSNIEWYKYDWVWDKKHTTNQLNAKKQPLRQHELICVFYKRQCLYNPIMHENRLKRSFIGKINKSQKMSDNYGKQYDYISNISNKSKSYPRSIISQTSVVGNSKEKVSHPTQKPTALIEYLINTYSNEGDLILDNTAGSMTTAIAAINTNRKCICIEKDDKYFEIGSERVRKYLENKQLNLF
jgi:site-specific DNA-methyltransferase (adenine-specific)